jgi:hypothetical protein
MDSTQLYSFLDELEQIEKTSGIFHRERAGRKPISMANLIDRHNELGHLPRKNKERLAKKADAAGSPQPVRGDSCDDPGAARIPRRPGEVPTKDPGNIPQSAKLGMPLPLRMAALSALGGLGAGAGHVIGSQFGPMGQVLGPGLGVGAGTLAGLLIAVGPKGREQLHSEIHDPRLYSNLRGAASLENAKERVAAHKYLDRSKDHSVLSAMREGFTRPGKEKKSYRLSDTTLPTTWGEDMTVDAAVPKKPGDVPTQGSLDVSSPVGRVEGPRRYSVAVTNDQSAKRPRKGETPTQDRDMNTIDRLDMRDSATTVHGLGQHSTNIGCVNSPAEHT